MTRVRWATLALAGVVAAASIAWFWLNRPEWGYCIEAGPNRGCEDGQFSANAVVGTVVAAVGFVLVLVALVAARGRRERVVVVLAVVGFVMLLGVAWGVQGASLQSVPMPVGSPVR